MIAIINAPCGIWGSKKSSKHQDQTQLYNQLKSEDSEVDLIYFEVWTDNQEFCGQAVIPLSSLRTGSSSFLIKDSFDSFIRTGIRSVPLYDKFNERLEMSALLIDGHLEPGKDIFSLSTSIEYFRISLLVIIQ